MIKWRKCETGWWDLEANGIYVGFSVANQIYGGGAGWFCFSDKYGVHFGPFKSERVAKERGRDLAEDWLFRNVVKEHESSKD